MSIFPKTARLDFPRLQRQTVLVTLILASTVVWLNAYESGVAKPLIFVLGGMLAFALYLAGMIFAGRIVVDLRPVFLLLYLHIALFIASFVLTYDPIYSRDAFLFGFACLAFFFVGSSAFTTKRHAVSLIRGIEWLTAFLCAVGALQLIFGDNLPVNFFVDPDRRIPSLLGNSVFFSTYLVIVIPVVLSQALDARSRGKYSPARFILLAFMGIMLLATQARGSMIAAIVALVLFWFLTLRAAKVRLVLVGAALLLAAMVVTGSYLRPELARRFSHMFDLSASSSFARRLYFWEAGGRAFLASPVVGYGIGRVEPTVFRYRSPDYWKVASEDIVPHVHNELLEIAVEYGSVGVLLCAATCFIVFRRGMALIHGRTGWQRWTAAGLTCGLAGAAIDNLANVSLRQPAVALLAWLIMGLLWSDLWGEERGAGRSLTVPLPRFITALPLVAWLVFAIAYGSTEARHIDAEVLMDREFMHPEQGASAGLAELQAAVSEDPTNLFARSSLVRAYLEEHRWEEAVHASEELQQRSPLYPQSSLMKAYALLQLRRPHEALQAIQRELLERTHPLAYQLEAEAYHELGDNDDEREALEQSLREILHAHLNLPYQNICRRAATLATMPAHRQAWNALLDSLQQEYPADRAFFATVRR